MKKSNWLVTVEHDQANMPRWTVAIKSSSIRAACNRALSQFAHLYPDRQALSVSARK